ncbi:MAG: hypothetical protein Q8J90_09455, partial [Gallionella sp.]|nr:hypothetical protein [Gallionella sp.]
RQPAVFGWQQTAVNLENAVEVSVGANLFARTTGYVRMNSHLQKQCNIMNGKSICHQLRFLG